MVYIDMDPRRGGTISNISEKRFKCIVVGIVQMVFWTLCLLTLIFKPSSTGAIVEKLDTEDQVIIGFMLVACIVFCALLVVGIFMDRKGFVFTYLIYVVVYIILFILPFIINIFTQPQVLWFMFPSTVMFIVLHGVCFFIVRCYYLLTYCNSTARQPDINKV